MEKCIIDRDEITKDITEKIVSACETQIYVMYSNTAIGKSSVSRKISGNKALTHKVLIVKNPPNNYESAEAYEYINEFFRAATLKFKDSKFSFDNYITNLKNKEARKIAISELADLSKNVLSYLIIPHFILKFLNKEDVFDTESFIDDNASNSITIKKRYLKYILEQNKCLIIIDNMQNIDIKSHKILVDIINETKIYPNFFLFEYTTSDSKNSINQFIDFFENVVTVDAQKLEYLPSEYAIDVVNHNLVNKPLDLDFNIDIKNYFEKNNSGNLRELLDYAQNYHKIKGKEIRYIKPTYESLAKLSKKNKLIIAILVLSAGKIKKEVIYELFPEFDKFSKELFNQILIEFVEDNICLCHASIADVWHEYEEFRKYENDVYQLLEPLYLKVINYEQYNVVGVDFAFLGLLKLYALFNQSKIQDLLFQIKKHVLFNLSPEKAWYYLKIFIDFSISEVTKYIDCYYEILYICFEFELYKEGLSCIKIVEDNYLETELLILYKAMYYSALDMHFENIEYITEKLSIVKEQRNIFNLQLISLSSYRTVGDIEKCKSLFEKMMHNSNFLNYPEYGYLLRLTDAFMTKDECIEYVKESVKYFEGINNLHQAGKSLITYSYILSGLGHQEEALEQIAKAEKYLSTKQKGDHMFLVNKAVIMMLSGNFSETVYEYLSLAELSAVVTFDKLAIYVNKLVWCIENFEKKSYIADYIIAKGLKIIDKEPDYHIHALFYYNLYVFYSLKKDASLSKRYYYETEKVMEYCLPVYNRLNNIYHESTKYIITKKWHICYLSYWTYDILVSQESK